MKDEQPLELIIKPNGQTIVEFFPTTWGDFIKKHVYTEEQRKREEEMEKLGTEIGFNSINNQIFCG